MHILQTAHSYAPEVSGVAEVVGQISARLAGRGHEIHVATGIGGRAHNAEILEGATIHRFDVAGNAVLGIKGDLEGYLGFVQGGCWDILVIHCAQTWSTDGLLPRLQGISAKKVFVSHGFSAIGDPAYRRYFVNLAECLRQVDGIVALSPLLEEAPFCVGHQLPPPYIIPNGVNLAEWSAPPRGLRQRWGIGQRPWILSVSNHSPVKGHDVFFEVVRKVRERIPDAVGMIVGGYYSAAKWGTGKLGIKGGCWYRCRTSAALRPDIMLCWDVPRANVVSAVQEADVVLVTSLREASPLVVLESMAAGRPWVSFDVGSVREHAGGIVVRSTVEMVDAVVDLLGNPAHRSQLGQEGQSRVTQKHDWESIVTQYEKLFETLFTARST